MSAKFYFSNGLKFWEWHRLMTSICKFEIRPNGAPLGEEITRNDNFKAAECTALVWLSQLEVPVQVGFSFESMRDDDRPELNQKWNPAQDSRIHRVSVRFSEMELVPERGIDWSMAMPIALPAYQFYKKMFVSLCCDEAADFGNSGESIHFHWVRAAQFQTIMFPYEMGKTMTQDEAYDFRWRVLSETKLVFPELSYGQLARNETPENTIP